MAHTHLPSGLTTFAALIIALGASSAVAAPDHLGAERCGTCHKAEYEDWLKSPHARSLARLSKEQQASPECRNCHTMDPWSDDPALAGVQCESCHGPGVAYSPDLVMRDAMLAQLMGLKPIKASTCLPCHRADAPRLRAFDYEQLVKLVNHGDARSEAKPAKQ